MWRNSRALPATNSFCALKPRIPSSIPKLRAIFSPGLTPRRCWMWFRSIFPVAFGIFLASCRQDMQDQPRYKPLAATDFFGDGRSARPLPDDTVARGYLRIDEALY